MTALAPAPASTGTPEKKKSRTALIVVVILSLSVLGIFSFVSFVFGLIKNSDACQEALKRTRANPAIVQQLGEPIELGFLVTGNIRISGTSGNADLAIPVKGPKGSGTVYAIATKSMDKWSYSTLQFKSPALNVDLLAPAPAGNALPENDDNAR